MRCRHCAQEFDLQGGSDVHACPGCGARWPEAGEDADLVTILESADPGALAVIRSLLDSAQIPYLVQGEGAAGMMPFGALPTSIFGRAVAAAVKVPASYAQEARLLLATPPEAPLEDVDER